LWGKDSRQLLGRGSRSHRSPGHVLSAIAHARRRAVLLLRRTVVGYSNQQLRTCISRTREIQVVGLLSPTKLLHCHSRLPRSPPRCLSLLALRYQPRPHLNIVAVKPHLPCFYLVSLGHKGFFDKCVRVYTHCARLSLLHAFGPIASHLFLANPCAQPLTDLPHRLAWIVHNAFIATFP
jgi:hypothetical protein